MLIPVPFASLTRLVATSSRFCGKGSSVLKPTQIRRHVEPGDVIRLALLAPEIRYPVDVNATVMARTTGILVVRYELADLGQMECALGQLYRVGEATLPVALDVRTHERRCRLSQLSLEGATFDVAGELTPSRCAPDAQATLQLPHQAGCVELPAHVAWVTPREKHSRVHISFGRLAERSREMLDDIVFRFRLGTAPWMPRLQAPGI